MSEKVFNPSHFETYAKNNTMEGFAAVNYISCSASVAIVYALLTNHLFNLCRNSVANHVILKVKVENINQGVSFLFNIVCIYHAHDSKPT